MAAESVEVHLARLEGSYMQINERLGSIEARMTSLESELAETRRELLVRMDRQFYWLIGVLFTSLASFATSFLVLLFRG